MMDEAHPQLHLLDFVEDIIERYGPLSADDLAEKLAVERHALAVIGPESVETYERDGETVTVLRGGEHRALSAPALERRLSRRWSGFRRRPDGKWIAEETTWDRAERFAAATGRAD